MLHRYVRPVVAVLGLMAGAACAGGSSTTDAPAAAGADTEAAAQAIVLDTYDWGGDFELVDQRGEPFRLAEHRGKVGLLFFGYTFCPDACPITMSKVSRVYSLLGADASHLQTLFVSVDTKRDTPAVLADYVKAFDYGPVGLTGSAEAIDRVTQQYKAAFEIQEAKDSAAGYLVSHTTILYLLDQQGRVRYLFPHASSPEDIASGIRQLLAAG